jgi:hypothetical protein
MRGTGSQRLSRVALNALTIEVENGGLTEKPTERAPGLYAFRVAASGSSAGKRLRITVYHELNSGERVRIASRSLPIAVDSNVARNGVSVRGGCELALGDFGERRVPASLLAFALVIGSGRRFLARAVGLQSGVK